MLIFYSLCYAAVLKFWLIMLNIMLKNKNRAQYSILISYIQACMNKPLHITDNLRKTFIIECIYE